MGKTFLRALAWVAGLLILALACWLLGVFLGWPLWKPVVLFFGVIVALLILAWLRRIWHAWRLRRRLARPAVSKVESTVRLDADWRAGLAALKQSRLSRFGSPLYVLPWFLALGPDDEARSSMLRRAASRDAISARGDEQPALQWWLLPGLVMLDPAPSAKADVIAPSASNWRRILHWMLRSRRREPLNGLVLSFGADWLSDTVDAELISTGQALRQRVDELTRVYNARMPVYIVLTHCETVEGFAAWAQSVGDDAGKQAMGYLGKGEANSIGEFIDGAFAHIVGRLCDLRVLQGIQKNPAHDAFGLPERMHTLAERLDKVLRPAFQATPYAETPLMRGLFLTCGRLRNDDHGADWFSTGLFNKVLPTQRNAWQPLEHWRHWHRLLRHTAVAGWLVACIATGVFLIHSAHVARKQLRVASQNTIPGKVDFSGGMSSDLHALHTIRYAIHSLDSRPGWERNWMPYQGQVNTAQAKLETAYADAFYREVLTANLNPLLINVISGPSSATPNDVDIALAQNLVRRINLLEARLDNKNLSAMPSPGPELTALMPALQNGSVSLIDGLLFGDMYRDYLAWQSNTHLLNDERRALQKALINLGLSSRPIQWVDTWAALQPQLQPMRMTDFWDIGDATDMPEVPAAMTLKGKQAVLAFMQEVAHASDETQAWEARENQFRQLFLDNGLQDWYAFSDAFIHAPDLLRDATSRRTVLSALITSTGPYRQYIQHLSKLAQSVPTSARPEWLNQSIQLTKLGSLVRLPKTEGEKQRNAGASTLTTLQNLKVVQQFGGDVIKSLPKGNAIREGFSSLDSDQQNLSLMQDYLKGVRTTAQALQQGSGNAMATAIQIWSFGHDPKVKDVALVKANSALEKLRKAFGPSTDSRTTVVWQLAAGPLDFTLDYAARSAACTLQNNWESNVVGAVKGLTDKQLADTLLFGDRGQVNAFLAGDVQHFVSRDGTQYQAREALGDTVPFSGQFYAFASLAQLRKASVAGQQLAEQRTQQASTALQAQAKQLDAQIAKLQEVKGNVTLTAEPPLTNPDAKLRPESITLTLQCASGPITLENLNFANSQVFPWSMSSCADTELVIRYPGFQLRQQWGGAAGFINFLKAYASGQRRYTSADFPSEADAMKQAGIKWLDVIFHQQGQADVLKAFAESDKLTTQANEVQAKLDAMQEAAAQAPDTQGSAGPLSLPSQIVTVCMGPANNIGRFTASSADARATPPTAKGKTPTTPAHKTTPHHTKPKTVPVAPVSGKKAGAYAVQVGIFAHPEKVRDTLSKAHYTLQDDAITLNGHQYRNIRAIGYDTRQEADDAAKQIAQLLKLKPEVVHVAP